jgi:hypothetical protein
MRKLTTTKPAAKNSKAAKLDKLAASVIAAAVKPASTSTAVPATAGTTPPAVAKPSANITRTAATVARGNTNFAEISDRDNAYFTFYKRLILAAGKAPLTVADIAKHGRNPDYTGSNKAHDAGVIVRLGKAGLLSYDTAKQAISLTPLGATRA